MSFIASQITSLTIVYSTVYSGADQRKHQSSASLAFVWGIHRGPVNSPHKWPVTRKIFSFDDVIMLSRCLNNEHVLIFITMVPECSWYIPSSFLWTLLCFVLLWDIIRSLLIYFVYLHIAFKVASLAPGQSLDCYRTSKATLKGMGKIARYMGPLLLRHTNFNPSMDK